MKIVIALGGNALGNTPNEQLNLVKKTAVSLVDLIELNYKLVIVHGNGPQVGMINDAFNLNMPYAECGAMSQGYIGYHLQNAIKSELLKRNINKNVQTLITQVLVDKNDDAFKNPTKPVGEFYTALEASELTKTLGYQMIEDSGRGFRRVVPSPLPIDIIEKEIIRSLVDLDTIIITAGGGGIPVIKEHNEYQGIDAVIDKDYAAQMVANLIDAKYLFILTAIERVMINFNTPSQKALTKINVLDAKKYINEGHFAPGSMLPKILAAIKFVENNENRVSIIASLDNIKLALQNKTGTKIVA